MASVLDSAEQINSNPNQNTNTSQEFYKLRLLDKFKELKLNKSKATRKETSKLFGLSTRILSRFRADSGI